jgi:tRNA(Ser,Leu) C12 N-acetylase TAN1
MGRVAKGGPVREWNVLLTSLEGRRPGLLGALRSLGAFWRAGYKNVVVGQVDDQRVFLEAVRDRLSTDMLLETSLTKVIPIARVTTFEPATLVDTAVDLVAPHLDQVAGGRFYVRLERRGFKGVVHTPTIERLVGERVLAAVAAAGRPATVGFEDPDVIVVLETTGETLGLALVTRGLRREFPFVRVS